MSQNTKYISKCLWEEILLILKKQILGLMSNVGILCGGDECGKSITRSYPRHLNSENNGYEVPISNTATTTQNHGQPLSQHQHQVISSTTKRDF